MEVIIRIDSDNADCQTEADLVRHLRRLADRIEAKGLDRITKVMDGNGNSIGTVDGGVDSSSSEEEG